MPTRMMSCVFWVDGVEVYFKVEAFITDYLRDSAQALETYKVVPKSFMCKKKI